MKGKYFSNQEIAELLRKIQSAYIVKDENRFRFQAYEKAAASIEHSTSELKDLWDEGKLEEVPGIGESIASHLDELFKTGKVKHFEEVLSSLPPAMFEFEKIPGIGAKTAFTLAKKLKITKKEMAINRLEKMAKAGKIRILENFGEKSESDVLSGIESLKKGEVKVTRMPLYVADAMVMEIIDYLKQDNAVLEADPLGSLRRMLSTIGDIDISVSTNKPKEVLEHFFKYPKIREVISRGEKDLGRVLLTNSRQVDIRISKPDNYGAMLQYFTGSKLHNIALREFALKKDLSLSEYGIKKVKSSKLKVKSFSNEESFYHELGLEWIPPEVREGTDEIEKAQNHKLPTLVDYSDIKGDLHLHSDFPIEPSHDLGNSSVREMIEEAGKLGYEYLGFSEHNPSVSQHTQNQILDLLKRKKSFFDQLSYSSENKNSIRINNLPIKILNGLEIDIKPNGELAIPDEGFDYLDFAIVSVHSSFDLSKEKMTKRVLEGLSCPKAKIFGHPTGRLLGEREGYELDWDKIFDFCLKSNKILEISAWPNRLDLPDFLVKEAVSNGVKVVINSDSHSVDQMKLMKYGVSVARRGWAEKKDILNTLPLQQISDILLK